MVAGCFSRFGKKMYGFQEKRFVLLSILLQILRHLRV
jgi:hypothetical protein